MIKKILIADDHPTFLRGLKDIIEEHDGFTVNAEASDGEEALRKIRELQPDLAVLDIQMPKTGGLKLARILKKEKPNLDVIILTGFKEEEYFQEAMALDVKGYLLKDSAAEEIIRCLEVVTSGGYYISPAVSKHVASLLAKGKPVPGLDSLTEREKQILKSLAENKTSSEIANALFIDVRTVQNHRNNICQKLGLHGYNKLLQFAIENKNRL
jgi:DNA-binding NarL/FixJ family response regulator